MRTRAFGGALALFLAIGTAVADGPAERVATASADGLAWVAWTVPTTVAGGLCCGTDRWDRVERCTLEQDDGSRRGNDRERSREPVARGTARIWVRARHGEIDRVRVVSIDCPVDTTGAETVMTGPADPADSVRLLATLLDSGRGGPGEDALLAIALHADPAADAELERQLALAPPAMRPQAGFWLAAERGERGARVLIEHFGDESDGDVRQELVFPLYVADRELTDRELIRVARRDPLAGVRKQALFWIAQRAGERATDVLEDAADDDPQSEVRQHAVFAISQLPVDRALPLLIDLAEGHRDPEVRRRSIFWLGEIDDPRATEYLISLVE